MPDTQEIMDARRKRAEQRAAWEQVALMVRSAAYTLQQASGSMDDEIPVGAYPFGDDLETMVMGMLEWAAEIETGVELLVGRIA